MGCISIEVHDDVFAILVVDATHIRTVNFDHTIYRYRFACSPRSIAGNLFVAESPASLERSTRSIFEVVLCHDFGQRHGVHVEGLRRVGVGSEIQLDVIDPGKPVQTGLTESFIGRIWQSAFLFGESPLKRSYQVLPNMPGG